MSRIDLSQKNVLYHGILKIIKENDDPKQATSLILALMEDISDTVMENVSDDLIESGRNKESPIFRRVG